MEEQEKQVCRSRAVPSPSVGCRGTGSAGLCNAATSCLPGDSSAARGCCRPGPSAAWGPAELSLLQRCPDTHRLSKVCSAKTNKSDGQQSGWLCCLCVESHNDGGIGKQACVGNVGRAAGGQRWEKSASINWDTSLGHRRPISAAAGSITPGQHTVRTMSVGKTLPPSPAVAAPGSLPAPDVCRTGEGAAEPSASIPPCDMG